MQKIVLYDGVCGLCNSFVRFLLRRDAPGQFHFASLQSAYAREILVRHGRDPQKLDTVVLVLRDSSGEHLLAKSAAVLRILNDLGGGWARMAKILTLLPRFTLDLGYDIIARVRYRVFGRYPNCALPEGDFQSRFLDGTG